MVVSHPAGSCQAGQGGGFGAPCVEADRRGITLRVARQVAQVREHAERRIAQLNSRMQGLESRLHQLSEENTALSAAAAAAGKPQGDAAVADAQVRPPARNAA